MTAGDCCKFDGGVATDDEGIFVALLVGVITGGVEDPNRDGIEIDEREEVDETGEGIAVTLVVVDTGTVLELVVLVVGANKFDIVGECFLLEAIVVVVFATELGDVAEGDEAIDCFAFGEDSDVDVLVLVEGILLFTVVDAFPFGMVAVVLVVWPLFCSDPT